MVRTDAGRRAVRNGRGVLRACVLATGLAASQAAAQPCGPQWLPGEGLPGVNGAVIALVEWDPDGAGPQTPVIVVGGNFNVAGDSLATNIAVYDPATREWSPLGPGINPGVQALAVAPDGALIVGGSFSSAGSVAGTRGIARWNGAAWSSIGGGLSTGNIQAIEFLPNGDLVAAGSYSLVGGVPVNNIARWDGTSWNAIGTGIGTGGSNTISALQVDAAGNLVGAGGSASPVYTWNGTAWVGLGTGLSGSVRCLGLLPNGTLVAGTSFSPYAFNGSTWTVIGGGTSGGVQGLAVYPNGDIVVSGTLSVPGVPNTSMIARWNGSAWSALGTGLDFGGGNRALVVASTGTLYAGGDFSNAGGSGAARIAAWDGSTWSPLSPGFDFPIEDFAHSPTEGLVAVGRFRTAGDAAARYIAAWDGVQWTTLGSGFSFEGFSVAVAPSGDLYAGGSFNSAGGVVTGTIARWNGSAWNALGTGLSGTTTDIVVLPSGEVLATGSFSQAGGAPANRIAQWNGTTWSTLGSGLVRAGGGGSGEALVVEPNGNVIVGGNFTEAGGIPAGRIARWDGSAWSTLASGLNDSVRALALLPNGNIVAAGDFFQSSPSLYCVARWDGTAWQPMASGFQSSGSGAGVHALAVMPSGDVVAGGFMPSAAGVTVSNIARWNGTAWLPLGTGVATTIGGAPTQVRALHVHPSGELIVGGNFLVAGGAVSPYFARWTQTNIPWIAYQPDDQTVATGGTAWFSARPANGYSNLSAQWEVETASGSGLYTPVSNGPIDCGGGASAAIVPLSASPIPGATTLTITGVNNALHGRRVRAVVTGPCGSATTDAASITLTVPCPADLTAGASPGLACYGVPNGLLSNEDFFYYIAQFAAGNLAVADLNKDGTITSQDFFMYLNLFVQGCPQ